MNRDYLFKTAVKLKQVNVATYEEYANKADLLITKINSIMKEREDIENLVGKSNINMMSDNHANHVRFIASILKNNNPDVLVDTILWVFRAYRSHGFTTNYWAAQLNSWITILKEVLTPESYTEVYPYYEWMQISIPIFVIASDEKLNDINTLH